MIDDDIFYNFSQDELDLVVRAGVRVEKVIGKQLNRATFLLDMAAVQKQCPLNLVELAFNDDIASVAHDILGIRRHINRDTGQLEGCFIPRFAKSNETRTVPAG